MGVVYQISLKEGERKYVGSTVDFSGRKTQHFGRLRNETHCNKHLQRAYNKHGEENLKFSILATCPPEYCRKLEQWFLDNYVNWDHDFNMSRNAEGSNSIEVHKYTLEGVYLKSFKSVKEAALSVGVNYQSISACCRSLIKSCGGFQWSYEKSMNIGPMEYNYFGKSVHCYNLKGDYIRTYNSKSAAEKDLNIRLSSSLVLENISRGGYQFRYVEDVRDVLTNIGKGRLFSKKVVQIKDGKSIEIFENAKKAQRKTHIDSSSISKAAKGVRKTAGGYVWKYIEII